MTFPWVGWMIAIAQSIQPLSQKWIPWTTEHGHTMAQFTPNSVFIAFPNGTREYQAHVHEITDFFVIIILRQINQYSH